MAFGSPQWMYASGEDFTIDQSLRLEYDRETVLTRTPASEGNRKTWTFSCWLKRCSTGQHVLLMAPTGSGGYTRIETDGDSLWLLQYSGSSYEMMLRSTAVYRDFSAWYHIVVAYDSAQAVEANRVKMYVNGSQITDFYTGGNYGYPAQDLEGGINDDEQHNIGQTTAYPSGGYFLDGYLAEVHFIDGAALTPTSFGETGDYGEWKPIEVSGLTYGTNGFYLDFADSAALGDDESGNTNDFTVTNLVATDQMLDSPTNNFATFNPLNKRSSLTVSYTEGNLQVNSAAGSGYLSSNVTMASPVGSGTGSYCEICWVTKSGTAGGAWVGNEISHTAAGIGDYTAYWGTGAVFSYGAADGSDTCTVPAQGDIIGVAIDDTNLKFYLNNSLETTLAHGVSGEGVYVGAIVYGSNSMVLNAGQDSSFAGNKTAQGNQDANGIGDFYYTPPSGYVALCTSNLPDVAVTPSEHFNTVLWTGTTADQAITGVGFQPDFVWIKQRSGTYNHYLNDAVRGQGKTVFSDGTWAEYDYGVTQLESFDSDGYTLDGDGAYVNSNAVTYVGWNWKAGTTTSGTTGGLGTGKAYSASYNTDAGFSIISWIGNATAGHEIPHHLGAAPEMIIQKNRDSAAAYWAVYNEAYTNDKKFYLNATQAPSSLTNWMDFDATNMTSNENLNNNNANDENFITYCFRSIEGYSKMGSYTGNSNADGTFVYTGFRPAYVMVKNTSGWSWYIHDSAREPNNENDVFLLADSTAADSATDNSHMDFLSNGFKLRTSSVIGNGSSYTLIYIAFAETPFKYSNAR